MTAGKYQPLTLTPINFSLTEGTSIPAPPDSPPDTPRPPTPGKGPLSSHPTPPSATEPPPKESTDSAADSRLHKTTTNDGASSTLSPTSPSISKRPSSVRKFLGLRPLSSSDSLKSERPGSPGTVDSKPNLSRKKSGSWFGKRKSVMIIGPPVPEGKENQPQTNGKPVPEKKGPPPPALPDLKSFGVSDEVASLGADDMFKDIK
ncbi:hypothetical protein K469DRAFT_746542 [Zopfia rhizophila CBS 207.26]|uniref:Uncharacterized protein n=1 Tax=Zopfia rhizophila CBS 207.26 TaxID=1314779 RepID=A0A6A6EK64_9PEZI|nr:hypothetical protein K469DRAFT_746542 [Zopfia rhizophila CBS 207.26]